MPRSAAIAASIKEWGWTTPALVGEAAISDSAARAAVNARSGAAARVAVFMPGLGHDVGEACSAARGAGGKSRAQAMPGNLRGVDADPLGSTLDDLGDSPAGQPIGSDPAVVDPGEERRGNTLVPDMFPIFLIGRIDR